MPRSLPTERSTAGYRRAFHGNFLGFRPFVPEPRPPFWTPFLLSSRLTLAQASTWTWINGKLPEKGPRGDAQPWCSICGETIDREDAHLKAKVCLCESHETSEPHSHYWFRLCLFCSWDVKDGKLVPKVPVNRHCLFAAARQQIHRSAKETSPERIAGVLRSHFGDHHPPITFKEADQVIAYSMLCSLRSAAEYRKRALACGALRRCGDRRLIVPW